MAEKTIQALGEMAANWFQPGERPAKPDKTTSQDEILDLMSLIRPWQISPQAKIRIGSKHDGGYVVPELACQSNLIVSIGIGHEISFDADLAGRGAKIYQFDHTIAGPPFTHPNMKFFKKGWGVAETSELLTFAQIMDLIDWTGALHPALKFDVEGAEWEALQVMDPNQLARFAVVVGEFHWLEHIGRRETYALQTVRSG